MRLLPLATIPALLLLPGCSTQPESNDAPPAPRVRVVTYNVNWGMRNPEEVIRYLETSAADIVCLQETHAKWQAALEARLAPTYPHRRFAHSGGAGGSAILSRYPLLDDRVLPAAQGWFPALAATAETPLGRIQILNIHLRPPLSERGSATPSALYQSPKIHRAEMRDFLAALDPAQPLLIAGDFNENEDDGAAGELRQRGFRDALAQFDRRTATWEWPLVSGVALKRRYDHILHNAALHCSAARVNRVDASDHHPVLAVFTAASTQP